MLVGSLCLRVNWNGRVIAFEVGELFALEIEPCVHAHERTLLSNCSEMVLN